MMNKRMCSLLLVLLLFCSMFLSACGKKNPVEQERGDEEQHEATGKPAAEQTDGESASLLWDIPDMKQEKPEPEPEAFTQRCYWDNHDEQISLILDPDGTGSISDTTQVALIIYERNGDSLVFDITFDDGTKGEETGVVNEDGTVKLSSWDTLFTPSERATYIPSGDTNDEWEIEDTYNYRMKAVWNSYGEGSVKLEFDGIETATLRVDEDYINGTYRFDGSELEIHFADEVLTGFMDAENDIYINELEGWFAADREDQFRTYEILENWTEGRYTELEDGARYYYEDGTSYNVAPADWKITVNSDTLTGDGFRELNITLHCGFSAENNPNLAGEYYYGCQNGFFDGYTGAFLMPVDSYYNEELDMFVYDYVSNGRNIQVQYNFVTEWQADYDGYEYCMVMEMTLIMPAEYDGIWMVALASEPTYAEHDQWYEADLNLFEDMALLKQSLHYRIT